MKTTEEIESLIAELRCKDGAERERARKRLVRFGKAAIPSLTGLLNDRKDHVRWEACKALGSIVDASSAAALVKALSDKSMEVRWLAAEGLIALEKRALVPLFHALETEIRSVFVRQGAHHILHALERQKLLNKDSMEVLDSLRFLEPRISVILAAHKALRSMPKAGQ